mmetsp:Transcript_26067/g.59963  ORF Transcript_26067/g.59963 Transcript_26067/m.59963 type:complete len:305 (+) Transcript_26067:1436-2350(+)
MSNQRNYKGQINEYCQWIQTVSNCNHNSLTVPAFLVRAVAVVFRFFKLDLITLVIIHAGGAKIIIGQVGGMEALADDRSRQAAIARVASVNKQASFFRSVFFRLSRLGRFRRLLVVVVDIGNLHRLAQNLIHGGRHILRSRRRRRTLLLGLDASTLGMVLERNIGRGKHSGQGLDNLVNWNVAKGTRRRGSAVVGLRGLGFGFRLDFRFGILLLLLRQLDFGKHLQRGWKHGNGAAQIPFGKDKAQVAFGIAVGQEDLGLVEILVIKRSIRGTPQIQRLLTERLQSLIANGSVHRNLDKGSFFF